MERRTGLTGLRAKAGKILLAGTLAAALAPAAAFAADAEVGTQELAKVNAAGEVQWPDGHWSTYDAASGTYVWDTYVKGDGAHYGHYDLSITYQVKDGELQSVDLNSQGKTYGGKWGMVSNKSGSIMGILPADVAIDVNVTAKDGVATITPSVTGAEQYGGYTFSSLDLYEIGENGKLEVLWEYNDDGTRKYALDEDDGQYDIPVYQTAALNKNKTAFTTAVNDKAKVALLKVKIGDYYTFGKYLSLSKDVSAEDIAKYEAAKKTDYSAAVNGIGAKNRDMWTQTSFASIMEQQFARFLADKEYDLDVVSSATKSSDAVIESLYATQGVFYPVSNNENPTAATAPDGWSETPIFKSVSSDLVLKMEGEPINDEASSVTKDENGNYVLTTNFSEGFDFAGQGNAVNVVGYDLYSMNSADATETLLKKAKSAYASLADSASKAALKKAVGKAPVASVYKNSGGGKNHAASPELSAKDGKSNAATYDPAANAITITDPSVTHVIVWYNHDSHGNYCGVVYDLDDMFVGSAEGEVADYAKYTVEIEDGEYTFDGTAKTPKVTVKDGEGNVVPADEYKVSYANNTEAGTATVVVRGKGDAVNSAKATFAIQPKKLANVDAAVAEGWSAVYSGSAVEPQVTAKIGDTPLEQGTDFSVSSAVDAGTHKATLTGIGNYAGELTDAVEFEIAPLAFSEAGDEGAVIGEIADQELVEGGAEPDVVVSYTVTKAAQGRGAQASTETFTLMKGADYEVAYADNDKVGTATVTVTGINNYAGTLTGEFKVIEASVPGEEPAIEPKPETEPAAAVDLSKATITLAKASAAYTGKAQKGAVKSVKVNGTTLKEGTDYTVSAKSGKKAGTYKVTITGKGGYTGTASANFKITQAANSAKAAKTSVKKSLKLAKVKKAAQKVALPKVTTKFGTAKWSVAKADAKKVLSLKSGKVVVKKGAKKGTYTIKLKAKVAKTANYKAAASKVVTVKVTVK